MPNSIDFSTYFTQKPAAPTYTAVPVPGAVYGLNLDNPGWTMPDGTPLTQAQLTRPDGTVWRNTMEGGGNNMTVNGGRWVVPGGGGGLFDGLTNFSNLGSSISNVLSDPNFQKFAAAAGGITGLANSGLLVGGAGTAGATTAGAMTPAAIESAVGSAGYGASAAADSLVGAGVSGAGAGVGASAIPGMITSGPFAGATPAELVAANGGAVGATTGGLGSFVSIPTVVGGAAAGSLIPGISNGQLLSTGLTLAGGLANADAAKSAAQTQADAQIRAAQIAADAAKFKPVGVTTGFGSSQFGYDANGNLTSAGYQLTPEMKAQRDALIAQSSGLMKQFQGAQAATAPMGDAAQRAMQLGQGYLNTDPQAQAQKYLNDQLGLLAPQRAQDMAALQAQMQAQGRGGFAIGGGVGGQGAANPQLQALLNAQMQQNTQLAANATQGGMDYAKFGAGMVGTGGDLLSSMYGTQTAAFNPYKTALSGAQTVEGLGQNALDKGISLGSTVTAANANAGSLLGQGMSNAANTMAPANAYSPWGALLSGAGNTMSGYKFDPMTGKAL